MKKKYQLRKGQMKHLVNALRESSYYFGNKKRGGKLQVNQAIVEALQLFLLDSKGKNVRRVVNAFRNIAPQCFEGVRNTDIVTQKVKISTLEFLSRTLKPKKFKEVEKFLLYGKRTKQPEVYPATAFIENKIPFYTSDEFLREHPQKISEARI